MFPYFHTFAVFQNFVPFGYVSLKPDWGGRVYKGVEMGGGVEGRGYTVVLRKHLRIVFSLLLIPKFKQPYSKEYHNNE